MISLMNPLISLEKVHLQRGGRSILRDIDLNIMPQKITTIVGPNGAGKSSLIALLLGLMPPSQGNIRWQSALRMSFVPQQLQLLPDLPMTVKRFLEDVPHQQRDAWLERLSIHHLLNSPLQHLSGGESQRLLLVRAILRQPDLMLMDEPASGIDPASLQTYYRILREYQREHGIAMVLVSHDLHLVMAASDEVICLNQHICCSGRPENIAHSPDFSRLFGSEYAWYVHRHDHHHV